jgi:glycosyltransferase involved in cell wall biosynthesis
MTEPDVTFTMWETNKIQQQWVTNFNKRRALIVPCEWNRDIFTACGVNIPIHKCNLGVDTSIFCPIKELNDTKREHFTFGCGGQHYGKNWSRKNLPLVLEAFEKLQGDNLRLIVKTGKLGDLTSSDPRVSFENCHFTPEELARWFHSLDCFVSASSTEGWGLFQQQALACGVPLLSVNYGGVSEFFRPPNDGWELDYTNEHPSAFYKGAGKWPMPTVRSLVGTMELASASLYRQTNASKAATLSTELMQGRFVQILAEVLA